MTEQAVKPLPEYQNERFHVTFTLILEPSALKPCYLDAQLSKGVPDGEGHKWEHQGVATFDGPNIMPPVAGRPLIPYLIYHLKEIESYLVGDYAIDLVRDETKRITTKTAASVLASAPDVD